MYILGVGVLGQIAFEILSRSKIGVKGFYDDFYDGEFFYGVPFFGQFENLLIGDTNLQKNIFIAIGDNQKRKNCYNTLKSKNFRFPNIIDPSVTIFPSVKLGIGNLILPNVFFGTESSIGSFNIFFSNAVINHHNKIESYNFFSPNSSVGGFSQIGNCCKIGMNCVIDPYLEIKDNCNFSALSRINCSSR